MRSFSRYLLLLFSILLVSCQQLTPTSTPPSTIIEPSPTAVPTFPSIEPLFNVTPTAVDFSQLFPITAENSSNLRPFLGMTQDIIYNVAWSPDGKYIVVATSSGLKLYPSFSLKQQPVNLSPFLAQSSLVAFSPTGTAIVWSETNSSGKWGLWLWNFVDGEKNAISIPRENLMELSYTSNGQLILGTLNDNNIEVWQAESSTLLASFPDVGDARGIDFSPDGRLMASVGHADLMAHVWNVETGEEVGTIGKPNMYASSVKFSPIGTRLAIGYQGSVQLWDIQSWQETSYRRVPTTRSVRSVAFSPQGDLIAASIDFESKMFVVDSELRQIAEIDNGGAVFSPDGKSLAVVTSDSGLKLFDTSTWEVRDSLPPRLGPVQQMIFRPDKQVLVSIHKDGVTVAWDLQTAAEIFRVSSPGKHFLSPDGKLLAVGAESGEVSVWDMDSGELLKSFQYTSKWGIGDITFSQDNHLLIIPYPDEMGWSIVIWQLETNEEPRVVALDKGLVSIDILTPDGRKLAVQTWENEFSTNVGVWDTQTRNLDWISQRSDAAWISSVALSPNREVLAVGNHWNGAISLYDVTSGTILERYNEPSQPLDYDAHVDSITFSDDSNLMVTLINGLPVIWDLVRHTLINVEAGCISSIESIVFSQDNKLLMVAGDKTIATSAVEGRVCIWESQTGKLLTASGGKNSYPSNFATFNRDGRMLATDDNGTIWLWGIVK